MNGAHPSGHSEFVRVIVTLGDELHSRVFEVEPGFVLLAKQLDELHSIAQSFRERFVTAAPPSPAREEIRRLTDSLLTPIGTIVRQLQSGDAIRGRCEHVISALREASCWLSTPATPFDFSLRATEVDCLLAIQIAQLSSAQTETCRVRHLLSDYFAIAEHTSEQISVVCRSHVTRRADNESALHLSGRINAIALRALDEICFLHSFGAALGRQIDSLAALREKLHPHLAANVDATPLLVRFAECYTMDAERQTQRQGRPVDPPSVTGDQGGRVEFF